MPIETLKHNVVRLAKAARVMDIPIVAATTGRDFLWGRCGVSKVASRWLRAARRAGETDPKYVRTPGGSACGVLGGQVLAVVLHRVSFRVVLR